MTQREKPAGHGCLFYLGIIVALAVLVALVAALAGTHYARKIVREFTDARPMQMTRAQVSVAELAGLNDRIDRFSAALGDGKAAEPLTLSASDLNALVATDTNLISLRDHFEVMDLNGDRIHGQMSMTAEQLGLTPLRGRFINATGTFAVVLRTNQIHLNAVSISTPAGQPFPATFTRAIRMSNLATNLNSEPGIAKALGHLQSIEVKDGELVIVPGK